MAENIVGKTAKYFCRIIKIYPKVEKNIKEKMSEQKSKDMPQKMPKHKIEKYYKI